MNTKQLLEQLIAKRDLSEKEAGLLMDHMMEGQMLPATMAAFLIALRMKGESVSEIVGFVRSMRRHMNSIKALGVVVDTCGTGGDASGTFNISTTVAFVVAGAGVKVAKHGNRAASSSCGSADVLEALGVNINLSKEQAEDILENVGMVFLFAPLFHPAMKHIAPVRKELGIKTVFNFLGPLVNPAGVKRQLIGVSDKAIAKKLSLVAQQLGYEQLLMVSSEDGMDEISLETKTKGFQVTQKKRKIVTIDPKSFGFKEITKKELLGGSAQENATIIEQILGGKKSPKRDIVLVNSAYALLVAGKVRSAKQGIVLANEVIDSGAAQNVLRQLQKETQQYA